MSAGARTVRAVRASPLAVSLGAVIIASGLVAAAPGTAAGQPVTDSFDQALQRDLDLTAEEADQLLTQESQARARQAQAREATGEDFAGAVFDRASGGLTVLVTEESSVHTVEQAGLSARVVEHGPQKLNTIVERLNEEGPPEGSDVTGWYPDIANDTVVVTTIDESTNQAQEFISAAGVEDAVVEVTETAEAPRTFAPIVGGASFTVDGDAVCSVGFPVESNSGPENGFVTAGHCGSTGSSVTGDAGGTGTIAESVFPDHDMAWASTEDDWKPTARVTDHEDDDVVVAGSEETPVGASVCRSGRTTGWHCGTVEAHNQTVVYPEGTVTGLTRTDACAEPGDSGGPFLSGDQAQGMTSGGSGDCDGSEATAFYQPVNPALERWDLDLVTG